MDIKLLTQVEKAEHRRAPAAPRAIPAPVRRRDGRADCRREADARRARRDPRASLSARRGDQVRRLHGRFAEAVARGGSRGKAEFIVFCGVHFMAESADILRAPHQKVVLPDLAAGCSMADMAAPDQLEICWRELNEMGVGTERPSTAAPASSRSPTSTRQLPSKRSSAITAASSARRPTPRRS